VAVTCRDGSVELRNCHDTLEDASKEADFLREQASREWIEKPQRVEAMPEDPKLRCDRTGGASRAFITARWNWLKRNKRLLNTLPHRQCRMLVCMPTDSKNIELDLLSNRIGGKAVLPRGTAWPTVTMPPWVKKLKGLKQDWTNYPLTNRQGDFYGKKVYASYLGTYDLRGFFPFRENFPAAISLFASAYDEYSKKYWEVADAFCPGIVVPLFEGGLLQLVSAPTRIPQFPPTSVQVWEMPDFEKYNEQNAPVYDRIEKREPNTGIWMNVPGEKVGGFPPFIQHDVLDGLNKNQPELEWHYIATYGGAQVQFGDDGNMIVLAGWDKQTKTWRWYCPTACY
jgi:hypothetical protein